MPKGWFGTPFMARLSVLPFSSSCSSSLVGNCSSARRRGVILDMAMSYCWVLFSAGLILWLGSTLGAAYRGAGDMAFPAKLMILSATLQVPLTAILVFGLFGAPALGVTGAAVSSVMVGAIMVTALLVELLRGQRAISLPCIKGAGGGAGLRHSQSGASGQPQPADECRNHFGADRIGRAIRHAALAGYGIGTRIEFVMLPVIFAFGTALTTIVGTNIGAGNYDRAELAGAMA